MTQPEPTEKRRNIPRHMPLMLLAGLALLAGLWAGLLRLGLALPSLSPHLAAQHGPLMVSGFLGTLISLERAVALSHNRGGRRRYYLAPLLAGLGALLSFLDLPPAVPRGVSLLGALGLVLLFVLINRLQPTVDHVVMGLGAVLWLVGNGLWLAGRPLFQVAPWWAGFFVLTISGERLELARVLLHRAATRRLFLIIVALFLAGLLFTFLSFDAGLRLAGVGLVALGLWLLRYDVARRTIRRPGLPRFIAACLLPGYVWLMVSGLLWLGMGGVFTAGPLYDAMLHTLFVGFVFSMIFGHAPIILPAVTGFHIPYTPLFYGHLLLLHLSLLLRVAGDLSFNLSLRRWGGVVNEVAIVLFLLVTVVTAVRNRKPQQAVSQPGRPEPEAPYSLPTPARRRSGRPGS